MRLPLSRPNQTADEASLLKYVCLAPVVIYDSLFFLLPLLFLVWIGFWSVENYRAVPGFSLTNYIDIFGQFFSHSLCLQSSGLFRIWPLYQSRSKVQIICAKRK